MKIVLDPSARSPLYRQLQDQLRYAISVGELAPGAALPSIRELEATLKVNRNTVRQAYLELEAEGLIVLRQGREARVAERRKPRKKQRGGGQAELASELAVAFLRQAEAEGMDGLAFAERFATAAREHDAAHPRCAFLECSERQALFFAEFAEPHLGRRVLGIDLHDLRGGAGRLPASVRVVLTPQWHVGEAKKLFSTSGVEIFGVLVRVAAECVRRLEVFRGHPLGLVVRDAESAAGLREVVMEHARPSEVRVVLADDVSALTSLARDVAGIVYTSPCEETVRFFAAPAGVRTEELVFEPSIEELREIRDAAFPALAAGVSGGLRPAKEPHG